jgi:hypothetical protein
LYTSSDPEIHIDLSVVRRQAILEAITRHLQILCTFSKVKNVRFEVSTAVTMMIIISQKMIIIKVKNVQDGRHISIKISEHIRENRLENQRSTVVE